VRPPHSDERRRRTDTAGRALARYLPAGWRVVTKHQDEGTVRNPWHPLWICICVPASKRLTPSEPTAHMGRSEPFATSLQEQYTLRLFCSLRSKTARKVLRSSTHSLRSPAAHSIFKNPREMDSMPVRLWRRGLAAGRGPRTRQQARPRESARSRIGPLPYKATTRAERARLAFTLVIGSSRV